MATTQKLRKWHFLFLGFSLILVSAILWYWSWRHLGIPSPLRPEHFTTIASFILGVFVLGVFVYRLNRKQVLIMLIGMVIVNLLASLVTLWAYRSFPTIFEILCPMSLSEANPEYLSEWRSYFLTPAVYASHIGLLILWIESLVMFLIRTPYDRPE